MARRAHQALRTALGLTAVAVLVTLMPDQAHAQAGQVLDEITDRFRQATAQWESAIKQAAVSLFWILAAIEFAVSAIFLALSGSGAQSFASEIVKRILFVGLFYFILDQGPAVVDAVIKSFRQIAQNAGGVGFKPSDIFNAGVQVAQKLADNVSFWTDSSKSVALLIAALVVVVCFALIAAIVIVTTVEMWIVTYAGIILLGFGGSGFTKDYAVKYLTYAISVGLKLMVMGLVVSIGQSIITQTAQNFSNTSNTEIYTVVGVAIVLLAVTKILPSMLQSIVVGASVGSNTVLGTMASSAVGAAVGAVAGGAAVTAAAARGGGTLPLMAGRAIGATAGAAFDRAADVPGSRMGSVLGNAASRLRQGNSQAARFAASGGTRTAQPLLGSGSPGGPPPSAPSGGGAGPGRGLGGGKPSTSAGSKPSPASPSPSGGLSGAGSSAGAVSNAGSAAAGFSGSAGSSSTLAQRQPASMEARIVSGSGARSTAAPAPAPASAATSPLGFTSGQVSAEDSPPSQTHAGSTAAASEAWAGSAPQAADPSPGPASDRQLLDLPPPGSDRALYAAPRTGSLASGAPPTVTAPPSAPAPSAAYVSNVPPPRSRPLPSRTTKTKTPRS